MSLLANLLPKLFLTGRTFQFRRPCSQLYSLISKIKFSGPLSVAEYMREILTNPTCGYYMNKDVFGEKGDFITSPEISQCFGEIIAIWAINEWQKLGTPITFNLVELGPGRGTMMEDILLVFHKLKLSSCIEVHLLEISKELSLLQAKRLCQTWEDVDGKSFYRRGITKNQVNIYWYHSVSDIPKGFSCFLAHEFFDALPIHKFQKTKEGWREILVDLDPLNENHLRFIISRNPTPASVLLVRESEKRDHVEVCPQAQVVMKELAGRLEENGGFCLIVDYGHNGDKCDTFRAFRGHKLHNPLIDPGTADLTADVDFSLLRDAVSDKLITFGPISQHDFLTNMHLGTRVEILMKSCSDEKIRSSLKSGYRMLVDKDKMGERFKFMSFFPSVLTEYLKLRPVAGFSS